MAKYKKAPAYTVIKDSREQDGYTFTPFSGRYHTCKGMVVRKLDTGDYSLEGLEDKVFDSDIAKLSALEALLAPAYARVLFPNQRMTNFLVQEAQDKMNLTGLGGTEEVLYRLEEITNQFDIYINKNEVLLGNQPVYRDDIKKFKIVDGKLVEIVE